MENLCNISIISSKIPLQIEELPSLFGWMNLIKIGESHSTQILFRPNSKEIWSPYNKAKLLHAKTSKFHGLQHLTLRIMKNFAQPLSLTIRFRSIHVQFVLPNFWRPLMFRNQYDSSHYQCNRTSVKTHRTWLLLHRIGNWQLS